MQEKNGPIQAYMYPYLCQNFVVYIQSNFSNTDSANYIHMKGQLGIGNGIK